MDKDKWGIIAYFVVILCAGVLIANYVTAVRDVSWVVTVEDYIKQENWEPDQEYVPLADWAFFLQDNGTEQFFVLKSNSEFISFINGLMDNVNRRVDDSISKDFLDQLLDNDRLLMVVHRFSTHGDLWTPPNDFGKYIDYDKLYFILNDNSANGLEGTIIVREHPTGSEEINYSVWQISKSFLW